MDEDSRHALEHIVRNLAKLALIFIQKRTRKLLNFLVWLLWGLIRLLEEISRGIN